MAAHLPAARLAPLVLSCIALLGACASRTPAPERTSRPVAAPAVAAAPALPPDTASESRARAVALLERSVVALGGREVVTGARGADVTYHASSLIGWQQARRWSDSTSRSASLLRYAIDLDRERGLVQTTSVSPGQIRFRFRNVVDTAGGTRVDLLRWRNGDDLLPIPRANAHASLASLGRMLPHLAVRQALRADASLRDAGRRVRDGRALHVVRWGDPASAQPVELEIDPESALPVWTSGDGPGSFVELGEYRSVGGVQVPHLRRLHAAGRVFSEQRIARVDPRPAFADSVFAVPAGYAPPPPAGPARATRVAGSVYRLDGMPGGYHSAFVVRDTDVIVLEAPHSSAFSDTALRVIAHIAPGKRVTHVMVTHHHNDHVGGLGPYVAQGAVIVGGAGLEDAIRRQLADSLRARVRFEPVSAMRVIGRGSHRIVGLPVPNTHADGNVAWYVPAARVLFQGDLFYIPERGAIPPAFPVTQDLMRAVTAAKLPVAHVVGVHGRSGTWRDVERSVQLAPDEELTPVLK